MIKTDVIIIGAGAAGLMCAIEAGRRGRQVLVLDHANKAGKKILMSGGGRCNFTNYHASKDNFISKNPNFCISALSRYTQWDFIELVNKHKIPFHEKAHGELFCDNKSKDILNMLLAECETHNVKIHLNTNINSIKQQGENLFVLESTLGKLSCESLVIATGGLSIPTMGATPFGYKVAEQFGLNVLPTRAGLVPFTLMPIDKEKFSPLSGVSAHSVVSNTRQSFTENILFTHRGLSGPAILQISSYWQPGESVTINLLPQLNLIDVLLSEKIKSPEVKLKTALSAHLSKRLVTTLLPTEFENAKLKQLNEKQIEEIAEQFHHWSIKPNGTEGYRTAEVTLGGVDCEALSSKTMEVRNRPGLYFIGEVLDMTGWLGGYNFQWAWSSGWAAGQYV